MSNQKLESHVVSLEIAKQLKEEGWKKETEFWWVITLISNWHISMGKPDEGWCILNKGNYFAAPLATEILEELPNDLRIERYEAVGEVGYEVTICYKDKETRHGFCGLNLTNALGKMWGALNEK